MKYCPCGTGRRYLDCCGSYLQKKMFPKTPEALMRSRYTAYVERNADYIKKTMRPPALLNFDRKKILKGKEHWMGLEVLSTSLDANNPKVGYVEFIAKYTLEGKEGIIHERSEFHQEEDRWYYRDGQSSA